MLFVFVAKKYSKKNAGDECEKEAVSKLMMKLIGCPHKKSGKKINIRTVGNKNACQQQGGAGFFLPNTATQYWQGNANT